MARFRTLWTALVVMLVMSGSALLIALLQLLSLGRARRFGMNVIAASAANFLLWMCRIKVTKRFGDEPWPARPCIYISNHTSTLDFFVITGLGIPNLRAFMTARLKVILPIWALGELLGHFFIPTQAHPQARAACFMRAEQTLLKTQDSVFLTPEGTRNVSGLGPFNRGAFHMAAILKWPIVPLFIEIPAEINPGKGIEHKPGSLHVYRGPMIDTSSWEVEHVDAYRAQVHQQYLSAPRAWGA